MSSIVSSKTSSILSIVSSMSNIGSSIVSSIMSSIMSSKRKPLGRDRFISQPRTWKQRRYVRSWKYSEIECETTRTVCLCKRIKVK